MIHCSVVQKSELGRIWFHEPFLSEWSVGCVHRETWTEARREVVMGECNARKVGVVRFVEAELSRFKENGGAEMAEDEIDN